jgi:hypothetical protein
MGKKCEINGPPSQKQAAGAEALSACIHTVSAVYLVYTQLPSDRTEYRPDETNRAAK